MVKVELVYVRARPSTISTTTIRAATVRERTEDIFHQHLQLKDGSTVFDALNSSGIYQLYPETKEFSVGVFSKLVSLETVLRDGDRLEVYRPLSLDPKEKRKLRATLDKPSRAR